MGDYPPLGIPGKNTGAPCDRKRRKGGGVWGGDSVPLPKLENFAKREVQS